MSMGIHVDDIEGEQVARKGNRNRECTQVDANSWDRNSEHSRPFSSFASLPGPTVYFSKVPKQLMQVVDFHDSFRYFHVLLIEHKIPRPSKTEKNRLFPPEFGVTPLAI